MIPKQVLGPESLLVTIAVDNRDSFCSDTFLYMADVTSFKLVVYDVRRGRVWRVGSDYFYPFPMDGRFVINGVPFNLMDGILALALGECTNSKDIHIEKLQFLSLLRSFWLPSLHNMT